MKKYILAMTVALAPFAAFSQNATVYGVLDVGVQSFDNGTDRFTKSSNNLYSTSRFGIKGSEDLGNGLTASFTLEGTVNPMTGSAGLSTVAANEIFNRESSLALSGKFGEVRLGRTDVSQAVNLDVTNGTVGNFSLVPVNGTPLEFGLDAKNTVRYTAPSIAGFTFDIGHATNDPTAAVDAQGSITGASVQYTRGAFRAGVGRHLMDGATAAAKRDFTSFGTSYDFGFVRVGYNHIQGDVSTTATVTSRANVATARVPLSSGFAVTGLYADATDGTKATNNEGKAYGVILTKEFSKRTMAYTSYVKSSNQANSSIRLSSLAYATPAGADTSAITLGLVHSF